MDPGSAAHHAAIHSASKTRVNALTALRSIRGTDARCRLPVRAADHVHQLGDLAALIGLVARDDRMLDAMGDMVA